MYKIYPHVLAQKKLQGCWKKKKNISYFFNGISVNAFRYLGSIGFIKADDEINADILLIKKETLKPESYELEIAEDKITIWGSSDAGFYYATKTLNQIFEQTFNKDVLECVFIGDGPTVKTRGFMLDISRDKIPELEQIKKIIDLMADLKMNHFELYVEGFSFGYPSFPEYLVNETPITVDEYLELQDYCNERCIDFVGNQNGFGHMAKWLEKEEYKSLAECEEGIFLWGRDRPASTLNPLDPRSVELLEKMYNDMLPHSNSQYFNMNFDEPFELGKGKSKMECEKIGLGNVYVDYMLKAYNLIKKHNKIPLIWGDILNKHPEVLSRIPKDMIFIDWCYDANYAFKHHLDRIKDLNIKFMTAPGTSSWCSFAGRTQNAIINIQDAINYIQNNNGEGVLLTDWGDCGHLQYLPITYGPLVFMGLQSWRNDVGTYFELRDYLNNKIYKDKNNIFSELVLDLGNYCRYEPQYQSNGSVLFYAFLHMTYALTHSDPVEYYKQIVLNYKINKQAYNVLNSFFEQKLAHLKLCELECYDNELLIDEIAQTIKILKQILDVIAYYRGLFDYKTSIDMLECVVSLKDNIINGHKRLWLSRNRVGGLERSVNYLEMFFKFTGLTLEKIKRGEGNGT